MKTFSFCIIFASLFSLNLFATSGTVTSGADSGANTLRSFIVSSTVDTIFFDASVGTVMLNSEIVLSRPVVIIGNGASATTISGSSTNRIFNVNTSGTVVLDSLSLQDGLLTSTSNANIFDYCGGAVLINDGTVIVRNSLVSGNKAENRSGVSSFAYGGAFCVSGASATLEIYDSEINNNSTDVDTMTTSSLSAGGAIYVVSGSTLRVERSTMSRNRSDNTEGPSEGGAVKIESGATSIFELSTIAENSTGNENSIAYGGGLWLGGSAQIINCAISQNRASSLLSSALGGGIYIDGAGVAIHNSTVAYNAAGSDGGGGQGGGIWYGSTGFSLKSSIVATNFALDGTDIFNKTAPSSPVSLGFNVIGDTTLSSFMPTTMDTVGSNSSRVNPVFASFSDLRLQPTSPAVSRGMFSTGTTPSTDLAGLCRVIDIIESGAYERLAVSTITIDTTVCAASYTTPGGTILTSDVNGFMDTTVRVGSILGCDSVIYTINLTFDTDPFCRGAFTFDVEHNIKTGDPCNCDDPANGFGPDGTYYFHDTLTIISSVPISPVRFDSTQSALFFRDTLGNLMLDSTNFVDFSGGQDSIWKLEFWRASGTVPTVAVILGTRDTLLPSSIFGSCNYANCNATTPTIPTLSDWSVIILLISILILGVTVIREPQLLEERERIN